MTLADRRNRQTIALWLFVCAGAIFAMIILGGLTRLTHSGLSMVEWKPITGWLPPMNDEAWAQEFQKYQQFPEFQKLNADMTLEGFKGIYWLEFLHRLLGRCIGLLFAMPFLFFLLRGMIPRGLTPHLVTMLVLGGAQGALGWFMVASGLVDHPDVSHYRLTAHLGLAVIIFGYILWIALGLFSGWRQGAGRMGSVLTMFLVVVVYIQILSGGLVAGLDAGFNWNTWPLMEGRLVPYGLLDHSPLWINVFENELMVQFQHRIGAYLVMLLVAIVWWRTRTGAATLSSNILLFALFLQIGIGIATLLYRVPVALGSLHQAGALLLFSATIYHLHRTWRDT